MYDRTLFGRTCRRAQRAPSKSRIVCRRQASDMESRNKAAHRAAEGQDNDACLRTLYEGGANLEAACDEGMTAAHIAPAQGNYICLSFIRERRVDLAARSALGCTPRHSAALLGHIKCFNIIRDAQVDVDATGSDWVDCCSPGCVW